MEVDGSEGGTNPFEVLPEELSVRVLRELDAEALVHASAVCSQWLVLCEDESLWRWVCLRHNQSAEWRELLTAHKEQSDKSWKQLYVDAVRFFPSTTVLKADMMAQLSAWLNGNRTWKLIYRASVHGFTAKSFHKYCDKKGPTVTVCKTEKGYVLGGYNPISWDIWDSPSALQSTSTPSVDAPFIFSLTSPHNAPPSLFQFKGAGVGVINNANYGPMWGHELKHDLGVFGYPHNKGRWSWSRLGSYYHAPEEEKHSFLAGEPHFLVEEVEVFAVAQERPRKESEGKPYPPERKKNLFTSFVNRLRGAKRNEGKP